MPGDGSRRGVGHHKKSPKRTWTAYARQTVPLLVVLLVVIGLAAAVLPSRDRDPEPPATEIVATRQPGDRVAALPSATPTVDLTAVILTPALIVFNPPATTPTPRQVRRPDVTPTPTPTPEFLPEQFITNGGIENDLDGWYVEPGVRLTNEPVHGGEAALLVDAPGGFASNQIPVEPGRTYRLSVWGVVSGSGETGEVGINIFDAAGQRIESAEPIPLRFDDPFFARKTLTFALAQGAARVEVYLWKAPGSGTFVVDDISVRGYSGDPVDTGD